MKAIFIINLDRKLFYFIDFFGELIDSSNLEHVEIFEVRSTIHGGFNSVLVVFSSGVNVGIFLAF